MDFDIIEEARIDEMAALVNRVCTLEGGRFTPALLRQRLWDFPHNLPEARLGAFDNGRLIGVMIGGLKDQLGRLRVFGVDAAYRERGIARRMLERVEEILRGRGATEMAALYSAPGYFMPGLDPRYTEGLCFLQKSGYERCNVVANMIVSLEPGSRFARAACEVEGSLRDKGIVLRRAEPGDRVTMAEWMRRHFPGGWELEVDLTFSFDPIPLWLAFREDAVVGFAMYNVELFDGGFGPTGVDASLRGTGVGRALLLRTLADVETHGHEECEIAWVGPVGFYARVVGAQINRTFWQMHKMLSS